MRRLLALALLATLAAPLASAQPVDVTFRFLPDLTAPRISPVARAFVPGSFNDWGPNSNGAIATGAPSQATYDPVLDEYRYTAALQAGQSYAYKIHYHRNGTGTDYEWLTDPLGTETTGPNSDSVVRVADPFVFQIAREQGASGDVTAVSAGVFGTEAIASLAFTVNGTPYTTGIDDTGDGVYRLVLPAPVPAASRVEVTATDALGRTASGAVGVVPPTVVDRPVPAGVPDGISYDPADPTRATLVLRAPGKTFVYALGSFNGWTADDDALMFRDDTDPLGTRWWLELDGLTPGVEVPFYYLVDGLIRVADPYTTKVYYPGEAGYPSGAEQHAVGVLRPGAPEFPWTDGDYTPPPQHELVIYELLVRDFVRAHSFAALTDTLDYLQRLGVNAIELMPVSEFDGDESWGYNPAFHLALDKYYGTPDDLKRLVDAAHARGMAVLLDVVYNHATGQSPLVRLYNQGDFGPPTSDNPWANVTATHPFNVFNDLDHTSPLTQLWLDTANRFWADEYHVDGYRFDLTGGFYQTGEYFEYNPQRIGVLTRMMAALWETNPDTYVVLEHLVENGQEWRELAAFRGPEGARPGPVLWHTMNRQYSQGAMGYPTATDFPSAIDETWSPDWAGGIPVPNAVAYMESHDEQWMMWRNRAFGNSAGGYDVADLGTALDRQALAGAFFLTVPGPRMLWQFGELGYGGGPGECLVNGDYPGECASGVPGRVSPKPIRWDYWDAGAAPFANGYSGAVPAASDAERADRRDLYAAWSGLLALRAGAEVFRSPETVVTGRLGRTADRWLQLALDDAPTGEPTRAVVFGNFGVTERTVSVPLATAETWVDYFTGLEVTLPAGEYAESLAPGAFRVWTNARVEGGATADERPSDRPVDGITGLFPNPAANRATLAFAVAVPRDVPVTVVDLLGRTVLRVASGPRAAGGHVVDLDLSGLPAGTYVVRVGGRSRLLTVAR